jgi:hypothetical protein
MFAPRATSREPQLCRRGDIAMSAAISGEGLARAVWAVVIGSTPSLNAWLIFEKERPRFRRGRRASPEQTPKRVVNKLPMAEMLWFRARIPWYPTVPEGQKVDLLLKVSDLMFCKKPL